MNRSTMSVEEAIDFENSAYIVGWNDDIQDYITEELQPSDYWVGGDEGGWTSDSNVYFDSPSQFENYLKREYKNYVVFSEESDRDDWLAKNV